MQHSYPANFKQINPDLKAREGGIGGGGGGGLCKNQRQSGGNSTPEIEHNLRPEQKIFPANLLIATSRSQQIDLEIL